MNKKPESYESAISKAWKDLKALELHEVAKNSLTRLDPEKDEIILTFLGDEYLIQIEKNSVIAPNGREANPFLAVLLLHYLIYAKDIELENRLITFRELEGGDVYYDAFTRRAILPITKSFGLNPDVLKAVGDKIGAKKGTYGDISIVVEVFPKIPVTVILWMGDEEIASSSNMLFDASIKELIPTEDVAVIGGFVASVLMCAKKLRSIYDFSIGLNNMVQTQLLKSPT